MPAAKSERKLTTYVWVSDEHGIPVGFGPGDVVPAEYASKVGDHCYAEPEPDEPAQPTE